MLELLLYAFVIGVAVAAISFTITMTSIFAWLRNLITRTGIKKLEELIHCPWCLGHYIALLILLTNDIVIVGGIYNSKFLNFLFIWFLVMGFAGLIQYVLLRAFKPVAEAEFFRKSIKK